MISFEDFNRLRLTHPKWVIHPLSSPNDGGKSPGKRPLLSGWQNLTKTPTDIAKYLEKGCNLGLVCGKASGVTVIDFDSLLFMSELFENLNLGGGSILVSQRTADRCHIFFDYNPNLKSQKHHLLGIEILNDGSNVVLPPSVHKSGDFYRWTTLDKILIKEVIRP